MAFARLIRSPAGAYALAFALLALPLWCVSAPGMPDYPAHLASFYLTGGGADNPVLARFYRMDWALVPNLASQILVGLPARFIDPAFLTRLYLTVTLGLWVAGPALIHKALYGRIGLAPLFGALFAYNANFLWGFLNYDFGAGAMLVLFGLWLSRPRGGFALLGFTLAATALYVSHLFAFASFALLIFADEAGRVVEARARLTWHAVRGFLEPLLVCIPAGLCYLFLRPNDGGVEGIASDFFHGWAHRFGAAVHLTYEQPDWVLIGVLLGALGFGALSGVIRLHRRMILPLIIIALAMALMPVSALGGWGLELRLPPVMGALLFASVRVKLAPRLRLVLAGLALALVGYHALMLALDWRVYDRQYREFRAASAAIPEGTRLMAVIDGDAIGDVPDQPYSHMAEFAIIDRHAFTPLLFTTRGQHVIRVRPASAPYAAASAMQGSPPDLTELNGLAGREGPIGPILRRAYPYLIDYPCHFDKLILVQGKGPPGTLPPGLRLSHKGSFFSIFDIERPARCRG